MRERLATANFTLVPPLSEDENGHLIVTMRCNAKTTSRRLHVFVGDLRKELERHNAVRSVDIVRRGGSWNIQVTMCAWVSQAAAFAFVKWFVASTRGNDTARELAPSSRKKRLGA